MAPVEKQAPTYGPKMGKNDEKTPKKSEGKVRCSEPFSGYGITAEDVPAVTR